MNQTMLGQQILQLLQMVVFGWVLMLTADEKRHWLSVAVGLTGKNSGRFFVLFAMGNIILAVSGEHQWWPAA